MKNLFKFLTLPAGVPLPSLATSLQLNGGSVDGPSFIGTLSNQLAYQQAANQDNFQSSAGAAITLTALQQLFQKLTNGGAVVVTIDSAYNIVATMPSAYTGQTFQFSVFSSGAGTVATPTLSDTAVTLVGTTSIVAGNVRTYQGQITQLSTTVGAPMTVGTTFTSLTQVGTTNNYTVALGTNALVPVVGQAFFLTVTTGTLPSGWYPINKVTSATSFVIAAPAAGTAWTATAGTVPGTITVPTSAYTPGLPGLYSPTLNITAMASSAAVV
jgi:hypothetical protein